MAQKRILVVDDSAVIRRYLIKLLEDAGYMVDFARNGQEALEKIRVQYYSLVTLDNLQQLLCFYTLAVI